ncbi:hypothetical protein TK06_07405 [Pseudomonas fluorescens]|uniref:Uncharacterized protein n=1 Tax=Pseudomonas fluorescens TaxID=294 RepID=A0A159ZTU0_PSEFL|nr:hypothetical protein TK06_07405 [Pseudomonas fluorescens]
MKRIRAVIVGIILLTPLLMGGVTSDLLQAATTLRAFLQVRFKLFFRQVSNGQPGHCRLHDMSRRVENELAVNSHAHLLASTLKVPDIEPV